MVTVTLTNDEYLLVSRALVSMTPRHDRCACDGCLLDRGAASGLATRLSLEYGHPEEIGGE